MLIFLINLHTNNNRNVTNSDCRAKKVCAIEKTWNVSGNVLRVHEERQSCDFTFRGGEKRREECKQE